MEAVQSAPPVSIADGLHFRFSAHFEEESYYKSDAAIETEDFWFWDIWSVPDAYFPDGIFYFNGGIIPFETFGATDGGTAELTVNVQGFSAFSHQAILTLHPGTANAISFGTIDWQGFDAKSGTFSINQAYLLEGENTVGVQNGNKYDIIAIDSLDIEYERAYEAHEDNLFFDSKDYDLITVTGFESQSADIALFDLSEPRRPKRILGGRRRRAKRYVRACGPEQHIPGGRFERGRNAGWHSRRTNHRI